MKSNLARATITGIRGRIRIANQGKNRILNVKNDLERRYKDREILHEQYLWELDKKIDGRTINEWIRYYNSYILYCNNEIRKHQKTISNNKILVIFSSLIVLATLLFSIVYVGPTMIGFVIQENISEVIEDEVENIDLALENVDESVKENVSKDIENIVEAVNESLIKEVHKSVLNESVLNESVESVENVSEAVEVLPPIRDDIVDLNKSFVEAVNESDLTLVNETIVPVLNLSEINFSSVSVLQYKAVIGRPVRWVRTVNVSGNLPVEIPKGASNISVLIGDEVGKAMEEVDEFEDLVEEADRESLSEGSFLTGNVVVDLDLKKGILTRLWEWMISFRISGNVVVDLDEEVIEMENVTVVDLSEFVSEGEEVAVEYYTEAPEAVDIEIEKGRRVVVSGPSELNYTDILAYALVDEEVEMGDSRLKVYWYADTEGTEVTGDRLQVAGENENVEDLLAEGRDVIRSEVEFEAYDFDGDGFVDYVEWVVPHLSSQVYEIIIEITSAETYLENGTLVADVFNYVFTKDDNWTLVNSNEYLEITFEQILDETKDITVYAKSDEDCDLDIYSGDEFITRISDVQDENWYMTYLYGLLNYTDTFQLRPQCPMYFDFIVDPPEAESLYDFEDVNNSIWTLDSRTELGYKFKHKTDVGRYKLISYTTPMYFEDPDNNQMRNLVAEEKNGNYFFRIPELFANISKSGYSVHTPDKEEQMLIGRISWRVQKDVDGNWIILSHVNSTFDFVENGLFSKTLEQSLYFVDGSNLVLNYSIKSDQNSIKEGVKFVAGSEGVYRFYQEMDEVTGSFEIFNETLNLNDDTIINRNITNLTSINFLTSDYSSQDTKLFFPFTEYENFDTEEIEYGQNNVKIYVTGHYLDLGESLILPDDTTGDVYATDDYMVSSDNAVKDTSPACADRDALDVGKISAPVAMRSAIKFSISGASGTINSADAKLYYRATNFGSPDIEAHHLDETWADNDNSADLAVDDADMSGSNPIDTMTSFTLDSYHTFNITDAVQDDIDDSDSDTSIALMSSDESTDGLRSFSGIACTGTSQDPKIVIVYTVPAGSDYPPTVDLIEPENNFLNYSYTGDYTFKCDVSDDYNISNVTLYGNWSGGWHANETNSSEVNDVNYTFTKSLDYGSYVWGCRACDGPGNCTDSSNYTIDHLDFTTSYLTRTCTDTFDLSCFAGTNRDTIFDTNCICEASSGWAKVALVDEVWINASRVEPEDSINVTCQFNTTDFPTAATCYWYMYYRNTTSTDFNDWGTAINESTFACGDSTAHTYNFSTEITADNVTGQHQIRCAIQIGSDDDGCANTAPATYCFSDNNDVDFWVGKVASSNNAPTITSVESISAQNPLEGDIRTITFNFTAYDEDGATDLNASTAETKFQKSGETTRLNTSCAQLSSSGNEANYSCSVDMWYFDKSGDWDINVTIQDNSGERAENSSTTFTYNLLTAMVMSPTAMTWATLSLSSVNASSSSNPILINNTGNNIDLGINITGYDLRGESTTSEYIYANNFSVDVITDGCSGTSMSNDTQVIVASAVLQSGNNSINAGDNSSGQEELYVCLKGVPQDISQQDYSSGALSWAIRIFAVLLMPANIRGKDRKRKYIPINRSIIDSVVSILESIRKKYDIGYVETIELLAKLIRNKDEVEGNKLTKALCLILEDGMEEYNLDSVGMLNILVEKMRKKYRVSKKAVRNIIGSGTVLIPVGIFREGVGGLEILSKYMKENLDMTYSRIGEELNRDQRTIWISYNHASLKDNDPLMVSEGDEYIPITIFGNRNLTVLESLVLHFREQQMKYSEIGKLLNRDQRNIWTISSRAMKKISL